MILFLGKKKFRDDIGIRGEVPLKIRFFGSGTGPCAPISWEGTILNAEHDDVKFFPIFENFRKSRNKV